MIEGDRNDDLRMYVAETAARRAGERALGYFRDAGLKRQSKGLQDFVSDADRAVEALVGEIISAVFPDDVIVGEEGGTRHGTGEYLWAVDPIDGTTVFLDGLPGWCVSIAVVKGDVVEMGVVHDPCAGETFTARRGAGAYLNGRRLPQLRSRDLSSGMVGIGYSRKADPEAFGGFLTALLVNGGNFLPQRFCRIHARPSRGRSSGRLLRTASQRLGLLCRAPAHRRSGRRYARLRNGGYAGPWWPRPGCGFWGFRSIAEDHTGPIMPNRLDRTKLHRLRRY